MFTEDRDAHIMNITEHMANGLRTGDIKTRGKVRIKGALLLFTNIY